MRFVRSISIPRSGHHYLSRLLRAIMGKRLLYYKHGDMPEPVEPPADRYSLWKTHDPGLDLPLSVPGTRVMVQWREPVGAMLSEADRRKERLGDDFAIEDDSFRLVWLAGQLIYHQDFMRKWMAAADALVIDYAELCGNPLEVVSRALNCLGYHRASATAIEDAVAVHRQLGNKGRNFVPRDTGRSTLIPADLVTAYSDVYRGGGDETRLGMAVALLRRTLASAPLPDAGALRDMAAATRNPLLVARVERFIRNARRPGA